VAGTFGEGGRELMSGMEARSIVFPAVRGVIYSYAEEIGMSESARCMARSVLVAAIPGFTVVGPMELWREYVSFVE
jgi:hypothetical protein